MTEIRLDVDLAHPPERVWRAVIEPTVLADWFLAAELRPVVGHQFIVNPADQAGFEQPITARVIEVDPPRRLSMRWQAPELDARVTISIARAAGGCRLTLRQTGFFGMQGLLRRRVLHRAYTEMLGRRLPDALDRLAAEDGRRGAHGAALARRRAQRSRTGEPASRRNAARPYRRAGIVRRLHAVGRVRVSRPLHLEPTVAFPVAGRRRAAHERGRPQHAGHRVRHNRPRPEWLRSLLGVVLRVRESVTSGLRAAGRLIIHGGTHTGEDADATGRGRSVAVGAGLLLTVGLVSLIVAGATALHPAGPPQYGGGQDGNQGYAELPGRTRPTESVPVSRSAPVLSGSPVGAAPVSTLSPGAHGLTAVYRTEVLRLGGYRGLVTITNPTDPIVTGWTVVITLPVLAPVVRGATGADYQQAGRSITFTPKPDTRVVPARGSVRFTFEVDGVFLPTGCTVDGRACGGIT